MDKQRATGRDAEKQLEGFVAKFEPKHQTLIKAVRKAMRRLMPTANELVYDNYNFFVIGYSPSERPSDSILSIAASAKGLALYFLQGKGLPDPKKLLLGAGNVGRFIRVSSATELLRPEVLALLEAAAARAKTPLRSTGKGSLVIRSVSAKQRPRRKV